MSGDVVNPVYRTAVLLLFLAPVALGQDTMPQYPLLSGNNAKPNIMFAIDDSGSMDFETLFETNDGGLWWDNDTNGFADEQGRLNFIGDFKYVYLFPNGRSAQYEAQRLSGDSHPAIPPVRAFAFARSHEFNKSYYDYRIQYTPWPEIAGTSYVFSPIDPENAPWDPVINSANFTVNLTQNIDVQEQYWSFYIADNDMPCSDQGAHCRQGENRYISYFPSTYYILDQQSTYFIRNESQSLTRSCSKPQAQDYQHFSQRPGEFSGIDALAPDGRCLKKVEIKPETLAYPSGRSYAQEIQNFANWFTYHRKRHLAMRGGLAHSLDNLQGVRVGLFWFNEKTDNVVIRDFDIAGQRQAFLDDHYLHVRSGGTPLRSALDHAGRQYARTDSAAPIIQQCQKNFTLMFTDGFASDTNFTGVGNRDLGYGLPYMDDYSDTLADIAMKYYTTNPRPDLQTGRVSVPQACGDPALAPLLDCNTNLHMNTFTVGLGVKGNIFDQGYFKVSDAYLNPPKWPDVSASRTPAQVDDLYHAAINGRGEIFNARTPEKLQASLSEALQNILDRVGSSAGVAFNASMLKSDKLLLTTRFNTRKWSGELEAVRLDLDSGELLDPAWQASVALDSLIPAQRQIITFEQGEGRAFRWSALSDNGVIRQDLSIGPGGLFDDLGPQRLDYIRGERTLEGDEFRQRDSLLGDIVHSSPVFVGVAEVDWPDVAPFGSDSQKYSDFVEMTKLRHPMVYVGANDGMLHGFDASTSATAGGGTEKLAYVPSFVASTEDKRGLHYLTDPFYNHRFYVDLAPSVSDVFMRSKFSADASWRTVLFGGLRNGGRGIFALDITDPDQLSEANANAIVLWEYLDSGMGDIIAPLKVAMMQNGQFAVIFGNGYNAEANGALYILFIEGGIDGTWSTTDQVKILTPSSGGLSEPAIIDLDGDKVVDRIYAGNDRGELWAFDVSDPNPASWAVAGSQNDVKPLFVAEDTAGNPQAITARPMVIKNPNVVSNPQNSPNLLVMFGTGQFHQTGDLTSTRANSFYTVWDKGQSVIRRNDLLSQVVVQTGSTRRIEPQGLDWGDNDYGYVINLPETGERSISKPRVFGRTVLFNTMIPQSDPCASGGHGWLMSLDIKSGGSPDSPLFDTNGDGIIDASDATLAGQRIDDAVPAESGFIEDLQVTALSNGGLHVRQLIRDGSDREKRLGWREIIRTVR